MLRRPPRSARNGVGCLAPSLLLAPVSVRRPSALVTSFHLELYGIWAHTSSGSSLALMLASVHRARYDQRRLDRQIEKITQTLFTKAVR